MLKFKNEYKVIFNNVLKFLGMKIVFDEIVVDFFGMCFILLNLYISKVKDKIFVEVNEIGIEVVVVIGVELMLIFGFIV